MNTENMKLLTIMMLCGTRQTTDVMNCVGICYVTDVGYFIWKVDIFPSMCSSNKNILHINKINIIF